MCDFNRGDYKCPNCKHEFTNLTSTRYLKSNTRQKHTDFQVTRRPAKTTNRYKNKKILARTLPEKQNTGGEAVVNQSGSMVGQPSPAARNLGSNHDTQSRPRHPVARFCVASLYNSRIVCDPCFKLID